MIKWGIIITLILAFYKPIMAQNCSLDKLPLNDKYNFLNFIDSQKLQPTDIANHLGNLPKVWWPLGGEHSAKSYRTRYSVQDASSKKTWQYFSYIHLKSLEKFYFASLNLNVHKVFPLRYKKVKFMTAKQNKVNCRSPWILEWTSNNPLTPQTKIKFRIYGELQSEEKFKPIHLEVSLPNGDIVRYVPKQIHPEFGIASDENLIQRISEFEKTHRRFRERSGLMEFKIVNSCPKIEESINNVTNLTNCLSSYLKSREQEVTSLANIHMNERNSRWIARMSIFPPRTSGRDKEHYSAIVDMYYNVKNFHWDNKLRDTFLIRFGADPVEYIRIDRDRVPSIGDIAGNGNWDKNRQFLILNIAARESIIELEYFKILKESDQYMDRRLIDLQYGVGNYIHLK